jgi:uncharacterized membrane protein
VIQDEIYSPMTLDKIRADRRLIEELASHGLITQAARSHALNLLYPHKNWGVWVSRLLLVIGASLILSGIVYFFAFNWAKIAPAVKLASIQAAILVCLATAWFYGLQRLGGKILLLSASVLVGVFFAVFGQIYQTGADAYNLFMMWSLLTTGWVIIGNFDVLWAVWLVVTNIFLVLYWKQAVLPGHDMEMMVMPIIATFNLLFLAMRECFVLKGATWLSGQWTRVILVAPILISLLVPTIAFIFEPSSATISIETGAALSVLIHVGLFLTYRYKFPEMLSIAVVFLSGCIIVEAAGFKLLGQAFEHDFDPAKLVIAGIMTICLFAFAIVTLRRIAKKLQVVHGQ